jgi:hypothetical protein
VQKVFLRVTDSRPQTRDRGVMSYERSYVVLWSNRTLKGRSNEKYLHTCAKSWHRWAAAEVGKAPIPKCTSNARAHANRTMVNTHHLGCFLGRSRQQTLSKLRNQDARNKMFKRLRQRRIGALIAGSACMNRLISLGSDTGTGSYMGMSRSGLLWRSYLGKIWRMDGPSSSVVSRVTIWLLPLPCQDDRVP